MTIDEASEYAREVGLKMTCNSKMHECRKEHIQLAKWLEEPKFYRKYG